MPSVAPASKQKYSRQLNRRGGGLVLECQYILEVRPGANCDMVVQEVRNVVDNLEGNEMVTLEEE